MESGSNHLDSTSEVIIMSISCQLLLLSDIIGDMENPRFVVAYAFRKSYFDTVMHV